MFQTSKLERWNNVSMLSFPKRLSKRHLIFTWPTLKSDVPQVSSHDVLENKDLFKITFHNEHFEVLLLLWRSLFAMRHHCFKTWNTLKLITNNASRICTASSKCVRRSKRPQRPNSCANAKAALSLFMFKMITATWLSSAHASGTQCALLATLGCAPLVTFHVWKL